MSLPEVQQRTQELDLRLRALLRPPAPAARGLPPAAATSFASALQEAQQAAPAAAAGSAAPAGPAAATAAGTDLGEKAVALAKQHLGTPYEWGGESPGGFDCSGLVQWTYKQLGIDLPRVSTDQARAGTAVTAAQARPGDLVFFERGKVDHIGIYAGGGQWVVAPKTGDVVKLQPVDLSRATTIRRIVPAPAAGAAPGAPATGLPGLPAAGQKYAAQIEQAARAAGISPALLAAVVWSESGFNPSATSSAGAVGLVQLMPGTAAELGVTDRRDPVQSLRGGATYLAQQLKSFGGRVDLALAAYNAGPGAVRKHDGIPPYPETQKYVSTVLSRYRALGGA